MKWTHSIVFTLSAILLLLFSGQSVKAQGAKALEGDMVHIPAGHFVFGTDKKDESAAWGVLTIHFNETYTQWKGGFDICGEGRKFPWNGFR